MKKDLSLLEQETIILFNRAENTAEIYTHEPRLKNQLARLVEESEEVILANENGAGGVTYQIPKSWIKIYKPRNRKVLTEEERKLIGERLSASRNSR